jgi:outer membrane biosynthesis protein TonB
MAVDQLERLLRKPGLVRDQALVVRFDLGRAQAALGKVDAARAAFQAVMAQDPKFQDVAARLAALDAPGAEQPGAQASDAGFESFDDMLSEMSDDEEQDEEKPDPAGETFDDLASDDDEDSSPEPSAAAAFEEESEPEPEPEPEPKPQPTARPAPTPRSESPRAPAAAPAAPKRKKKISFL